MRILLLDDKPKIDAYYKKGLTESGFIVDVTQSVMQSGICKWYDLVIIDIAMLEMDNEAILIAFKAMNPSPPLLALTAGDSMPASIKELKMNCLAKPFSFSELLMRVRSILRTHKLTRVAGLEIDLTHRRATRDGQRLDLTPKEFAILSLLARRNGEVLSRKAISEQVWDMDFDVETNIVDVYVSRLRKKVDGPFGSILIHTIRGKGYILEKRH